MTATATDTRVFHLEGHFVDPSDEDFGEIAVHETTSLIAARDFMYHMFSGLDSDEAMADVTALCERAGVAVPSEQSHGAVVEAIARVLNAMDPSDDLIAVDVPGIRYALWRNA